MDMELATQLARIYNTLMTINTCGKDTRKMSRCLEEFEALFLQFNEASEIKE